MSTTESKRVNDYRKKNFDQLTLLVPKGGRALFHVLALKEGLPLAEHVRRAVLNRAGLSLMPYPKDMVGMEDITTQAEAVEAVAALQAMEDNSASAQKKIAVTGPENDDMRFSINLTEKDALVLIRMNNLLKIRLGVKQSQGNTAAPVQVTLSGDEVRSLRRVLASLTPVDPLVQDE